MDICGAVNEAVATLTAAELTAFRSGKPTFGRISQES